MSVEVALEELDVDLEDNRVHASLSLDLDELFNTDGELRLWEDDEDWSGFLREDGAFWYVDTTRPDFVRKVRVGERAVLLAIQARLESPDVGDPAQFVRRAEP